MSTLRALLLALVAAAIVPAMVACGDDSDSDTDAAAE